MYLRMITTYLSNQHSKSIHILQPHNSARKPKLHKEYAFLLPEKICFKKIPSLLKNFKNAIPLPNRQKRILTMTVKFNTDKGFGTRTTITPACNSVYVSIAGEVIIRRSVILRNFVLNGQESASKPLLHIHANRYMAF